MTRVSLILSMMFTVTLGFCQDKMKQKFKSEVFAYVDINYKTSKFNVVSYHTFDFENKTILIESHEAQGVKYYHFKMISSTRKGDVFKIKVTSSDLSSINEVAFNPKYAFLFYNGENETYTYGTLTIISINELTNAQLIDGIWKTYGHKLATTQNGAPISENDPITKRFDNVLDKLDVKFTDDKKNITDLVINTWIDLKLSGIDDPMFNIMEGINDLSDLKTQNRSFADYLNVFRILRKKCVNYLCSINSMQNLLNEDSMDEVKRRTGL